MRSLLPQGEGERGGERRRGAGVAVSRGMRRRPLLPLLLLALLRAHGLLAASGDLDLSSHALIYPPVRQKWRGLRTVRD
ncbi:unnamed protein product, partial [Iphiclides podalirius]